MLRFHPYFDNGHEKTAELSARSEGRSTFYVGLQNCAVCLQVTSTRYRLPVLKLAEVYFGKKICGVIRRVLVHVACMEVQL
jgi:hypothetical protein